MFAPEDTLGHQILTGHLQTEFSTLNVIVTLRGWGIEAMTLRTIAGITRLLEFTAGLEQASSKCDVKRRGEGMV